MQNKIGALTLPCESLREARLALSNLAKQEAELKAAQEKLKAQLDKIPVESLAVPMSDEKSFDRATARLLSNWDDVQIKLALLPGVRVRYEAAAEGLRQQIRIGVKALLRHCRDESTARMEALQAKLATELLATCGGDADRAKAAAAGVVEKSESRNWEQTFAYRTHATDPLDDAETVIRLANRFDRGEPCD
jgi:hypothetical protein